MKRLSVYIFLVWNCLFLMYHFILLSIYGEITITEPVRVIAITEAVICGLLALATIKLAWEKR